MKNIDTVQRDWILVIIILPLGILLMLLVGQLAIRLDPEWRYAADMQSYLDPDSDYRNQRGNAPVEPVLVDILTPPSWKDVFLTPNATYPTLASSPTPSPTYTPSPLPTEIPGTPATFTPTPSYTPTATPTRYTLTINIIGNGRVNKNPNQATYLSGSSVQLLAIPDPGWTFSGWSGDMGGPANPATILMNGNKTITATFTQIEYTLVINTIGSGIVTRNPNQATYHYGDVVQLTAYASTGWVFDSWSGALSGSANPTAITIDGNKTVTATFTQIQYTLTINTIGSGTVTRNPNQATYHYGDVVQLTANPSAGWVFDSWSGDLSGSANPSTITIDGNKTVTATFTQVQYTLTINIVGNGSVTKSPNQVTYPAGTSVLLTANPSTGWIFSGWSGDLSGPTNPDSILMDSDKTVTATFTAIEYTLTINIVGGGIVIKNPDQATYHYGDVVQLTADPDLDWLFESWSGDLSGSTNPDTITINGNRTVTANFVYDTNEPDIGQPDGNFRILNDDEFLIIDLGTTIEVLGGGEPSYDLVYYEYAFYPDAILMDWVILQISTDQSNWYTIFYWGDYVNDGHTNVSGITEDDNAVIPMSSLYGTLPFKTGIAIDVDGAPGVAVPAVPALTNTILGPVPPGSYRYLRIYAPIGGGGDGVGVDSIDVLP